MPILPATNLVQNVFFGAASAHGSTILSDLAWIMVGAALTAIVCSRIKVPPLLGYLATGLLLGPNLGIWPAIVSPDNVQDLSELGVVFLMFYIGLEFDISKVRQVFAPAASALILQTILMLIVGLQASQWLGLSTIDGWFLGGLLSISSSMVSVKLMRESGEFERPHGQLAVGILVFEDMLAILLLVLLTGIASDGQFNYSALVHTAFFIALFIVTVFLLGKLGSKRLVEVLERRGTTEMVTMCTLGLIFGVSLIAEQFHFSWALGGFLAGAIFSSTRIAHQIESLTEPLRDLFSALFFVTVGMLIQPTSLLDHAPTILAISAIVIVGKFAACWLGLFLSGQTARSAGRASLIKAQIGEFTFVITALGARHSATSEDLQSIAAGVAFVTILLTPILMKQQGWILGSLERGMPRASKEFAALYARWLNALKVSFSRSVLKLARGPLLRIALHFLIINSIIISAAILSNMVKKPDFIPLDREQFSQAIFLLSLLVSLPFFVDTVRNINVTVLLLSDAALSRPVFHQFTSGAFRAVFNGLGLLVALIVYGGFFIVVASPFFPTGAIFAIFALVSIGLGLLFWRRLVHLHNNWELAFLRAMENESQSRIEKRIASNLSALETKDPWPVKIEHTEIGADSKWAGKEIRHINLRRETGTTIAGIERAGFDVTDILPHTRLFPRDKVFLLGEPDQIAAARRILGQLSDGTPQGSPFSFAKCVVPPLSPFIGLPIKETDLRSTHGVTIVGIQRHSERIVSPSPDERLLEADILLVMGNANVLANISQILQGPPASANFDA